MPTYDEWLLIVYRFGLLILAMQLAVALYPHFERAGFAVVRLARRVWHV